MKFCSVRPFSPRDGTDHPQGVLATEGSQWLGTGFRAADGGPSWPGAIRRPPNEIYRPFVDASDRPRRCSRQPRHRALAQTAKNPPTDRGATHMRIRIAFADHDSTANDVPRPYSSGRVPAGSNSPEPEKARQAGHPIAAFGDARFLRGTPKALSSRGPEFSNQSFVAVYLMQAPTFSTQS